MFQRRKSSFIVLVIAITLQLVSGSSTSWGPFLLNPGNSLTTLPSDTTVCSLQGGGFVLAYTGTGTQGSGVYGTGFTTTGATTAFDIKTTWSRTPNVAPLNSGGFLLTYNNLGGDGNMNGQFYAPYGSNFSPLTSASQVNTFNQGDQAFGTATSLKNGDYVITWHSENSDGNSYGVVAKCYHSNGAVFKEEFQVNTYTVDYQNYPNVAALDDGGFVITWQTVNKPGDSGLGSYAQRFDSSCNKFGTEFPAAVELQGHQGLPTIAAVSNGGFVITYNGQDSTGRGTIYAQIFDASSVGQGEFQVSSVMDDIQQYNPSVVQTPNGFLIAWHARCHTCAKFQIKAQYFDTTGNALGSEIIVTNDQTYDHSDAKVAFDKTTNYLAIIWTTAELPNFSVYATIYNNLPVVPTNKKPVPPVPATPKFIKDDGWYVEFTAYTDNDQCDAAVDAPGQYYYWPIGVCFPANANSYFKQVCAVQGNQYVTVPFQYDDSQCTVLTTPQLPIQTGPMSRCDNRNFAPDLYAMQVDCLEQFDLPNFGGKRGLKFTIYDNNQCTGTPVGYHIQDGQGRCVPNGETYKSQGTGGFRQFCVRTANGVTNNFWQYADNCKRRAVKGSEVFGSGCLNWDTDSGTDISYPGFFFKADCHAM